MTRTISYSQMSKFWECPRKWYNTYIEDYRPYEPPYFAFGKAVHSYIENKLEDKQFYLTQADLPQSKNLDEDIENVIKLGDNAVNSLTEFADFGLHNILIDKKIELEFTLDVENGKFRGFIDLSFINKYDEHIIVDWKTTSREFSEHDIRTSNQLTCYAYAYWRLFGTVPNKVCYVTLNKKTFETKLYTGTRTLEDVHSIEKQIIDTLYAMERVTNHRNENSCNGKYGKCPFYKQCWNGEVNMVEDGIKLWEIKNGTN